MANVSAPYNFVPLNEKVFFPPWANLVNHDVPFKEGLSGQIELEITAESPIFIRKPYEESDEIDSYYTNAKGVKISKEFCHIKDKNDEKRYYIPGSSIRNMLRSVVEIMSFSKLSFFNKPNKFSFRDMANTNLYSLMNNANNLNMGWLVKEDQGIKILYVGDLGNLRGQNVNSIYRPDNYDNRDLDFFKKISSNDYTDFISPDTKLEKKYKIYNNSENDFRNGYKESAATLNNYNDNQFDDVIVITGNIDGKRNEFLFKKPQQNNIKDKYDISGKVFQSFVISNTVKDENSDNWNFWESKFNNNEYIPVFFRTNNDNVIDFGLVVLYKMAYNFSLLETIKRNQPEVFDKKLDLVETLFGSIENDFKLKGRIQVSHAFSQNATTSNEHNLILGEPKISFYPSYIKQSVKNNGNLQGQYRTLHNNNAEISGRKRYPIQYIFEPNYIAPNNNQNGEENVSTSFLALRENTKFKTKINYHNLLPIELGALLSAITFHNTNKTRHNIGLAKPYGFGRVSIHINNMEKETIKNYIGLYQKIMNDFTSNKSLGEWIKTTQLVELISMAHLFIEQDKRKLKYMQLQDHQNIKKRRINRVNHNPKALPLYSKFLNHSLAPNNISTIMSFDIQNYTLKEDLEQLYKNKVTEIQNIINNLNSQLTIKKQQ
ncbi:hypothetical protein Lupro_02540 [Lutibacter profundi]|uniref:CRISPR-associated protein n=1 Tax=Lutibacter profundi TaxID=1622118 RepID=A0A120IE07_9FLAO|nr:TIGR03986 family CRISPR-associated RAMP protein [Lutibacter profundi]AMC10197.1 hypothetical protein Lupro_02540 [Lutibacter profundi]